MSSEIVGKVVKWIFGALIIYFVSQVVLNWTVPTVVYDNKSNKKRVALIMLGDIGHSPRMCYHARSFSEQGWDVELCGFLQEDPCKDILEDPHIAIHVIPELELLKNMKSYLLKVVLKVLHQFYSMINLVWRLRKCDYVIMQNPPSIPILPMLVVFKAFTGAVLIIDWHNFGYTLVELRYKTFYHPVVLISFLSEFLFGRAADYHLTVTSAMKNYLVNKWQFDEKYVTVLYDRPGDQFYPLKPEDRIAALQEDYIKKYIPEGFDITKGDSIFVTSTSFSADEDLSMLIDVLNTYENSQEKFDSELPRILLFITGKGPLKHKYVGQVRDHKWKKVKIEFLWLSAQDYPKLLRVCDFAVSLHSSSSGLDLPMKILDMFGSGIPVIALDYPVLGELVKHNINGWKFSDIRELKEALILGVKDKDEKARLKKSVLQESKYRWRQSWSKAINELRLIHSSNIEQAL